MDSLPQRQTPNDQVASCKQWCSTALLTSLSVATLCQHSSYRWWLAIACSNESENSNIVWITDISEQPDYWWSHALKASSTNKRSYFRVLRDYIIRYFMQWCTYQHTYWSSHQDKILGTWAIQQLQQDSWSVCRHDTGTGSKFPCWGGLNLVQYAHKTSCWDLLHGRWPTDATLLPVEHYLCLQHARQFTDLIQKQCAHASLHSSELVTEYTDEDLQLIN